MQTKSNARRAISVACVFAVTACAQGYPPLFAPFAQLGKGYNVLTEDFQGSIVDMGAYMGNQTFSYKGRVYRMPAALQSIGDVGTDCVLKENSEISKGFSSYMGLYNEQVSSSWSASHEFSAKAASKAAGGVKSQRPAASLSLGTIGVFGSKTKAVTEMSEMSSQEEYHFFTATVKCDHAKIIARDVDQPLNRDFVKSLALLPTYYLPEYGSDPLYSGVQPPVNEYRSPTSSIFYSFFNSWGTHYYRSIRLGAKLSTTRRANSCQLYQRSAREETYASCLGANLDITSKYGTTSGAYSACRDTEANTDVSSDAATLLEAMETTVRGGSNSAGIEALVSGPNLFSTDKNLLKAWLASTFDEPGVTGFELETIPEFVRKLGEAKSRLGKFCDFCDSYPDFDYATISKAMNEALVDYVASSAVALYSKRKCTTKCSSCDDNPFSDCRCCSSSNLDKTEARKCCTTNNQEVVTVTGFRLNSKGDRGGETNWQVRIGNQHFNFHRGPRKYSKAVIVSVTRDEDIFIKAVDNNVAAADKELGTWHYKLRDAINAASVVNECDNTFTVGLNGQTRHGSMSGKVDIALKCADPNYVGKNCDMCRVFCNGAAKAASSFGVVAATFGLLVALMLI